VILSEQLWYASSRNFDTRPQIRPQLTACPPSHHRFGLKSPMVREISANIRALREAARTNGCRKKFPAPVGNASNLGRKWKSEHLASPWASACGPSPSQLIPGAATR